MSTYTQLYIELNLNVMKQRLQQLPKNDIGLRYAHKIAKPNLKMPTNINFGRKSSKVFYLLKRRNLI